MHGKVPVSVKFCHLAIYKYLWPSTVHSLCTVQSYYEESMLYQLNYRSYTVSFHFSAIYCGPEDRAVFHYYSNRSKAPHSVAYPGGGPGCSNTPLSVHFINYSLQSVNDSTYDSLHDTAHTAQLALAPSEKTITGATSSCYALRVIHYSQSTT